LEQDTQSRSKNQFGSVEFNLRSTKTAGIDRHKASGSDVQDARPIRILSFINSLIFIHILFETDSPPSSDACQNSLTKSCLTYILQPFSIIDRPEIETASGFWATGLSSQQPNKGE
jgi:hypothetical protein